MLLRAKVEKNKIGKAEMTCLIGHLANLYPEKTALHARALLFLLLVVNWIKVKEQWTAVEYMKNIYFRLHTLRPRLCILVKS